MTHHLGQRAAPAPYALPAGFAMFLAVGTAAAALHGRLTGRRGADRLRRWSPVAVSFAAEPVASVLLAGIGWLTVIGFSRPPYAQLRPAGPAAVHAAVVVGRERLGRSRASAWCSAGTGRRLTLVSVGSDYGHAARRLFGA